MATTSTVDEVEIIEEEAVEEIPHYILARYGISRLLNNKQEEAENLFLAYPESLDMNAGYAYAVFSDAVMTFEEDKIELALRTLKDLEKKCIASTHTGGWFKTMKAKVWGSEQDLEMHLANQLVLADCYVLVAAITFLQQDISGFIKASWLLRKAFKIYESSYAIIQGLLPDDAEASKTDHKAEHKHKILDKFKQHNLGKPNNAAKPNSKVLTRPKSHHDVIDDPDIHVELVGVDDALSFAPRERNEGLKTDMENIVSSMVPGADKETDSVAPSMASATPREQAKADEVIWGGFHDNDEASSSSPGHHHHHHQPDPTHPHHHHVHDANIPHAHHHHHHSHHPQGIKPADLPCSDIMANKFPQRSPSAMMRNGYMVIPSYSSSLGSSDSKHSISYLRGRRGNQDEGYVSHQSVSSSGQRDTVSSDAHVNRPMRKSRSAHNYISSRPPQSTLTTSLSFLATPLNFFTNYKHVRKATLDPDHLERLHCQVSFGFGLLQLGISLLPPSVLKLINFFGFGGNRKTGLEYLMFARKGDDMRAPFATLALLWYHTIIRPFFALDGNNVQAGVSIAAQLIRETHHEFSHSSLFLFFTGRVERLEPDIEAAIDAFDQSISYSTQREVKVMAMHEIGWCYLILLDYNNAENTFLCLKQASRWSRPFYSYIAMVAGGANNHFKDRQKPMDLRDYFPPVTKGTQLDEFLMRRYKICPTTEIALRNLNVLFWKLLSYEMLYLWNTLPSCSFRVIDRIAKDCVEAHTLEVEPMLGLGKLIEGSCQCILGRTNLGKVCFRECDNIRKHKPVNADDAHISAFANYELGLLYLKDKETAAEGRRLLEYAAKTYKGYDFEQRLTVRVHAILKNQ